ncbi:MAG: DUF1232 domain-containing protein [Bacteroidetes bacterium]|jgi:uncharacterized membrane protein YkvA (DUF1232 family)|nr:DUF1232 domain-containing protein [Candidatus Scalindua sp.]MBT7828029.1 DUF1232 domain-containing protein [Bacteroidota bacterium]
MSKAKQLKDEILVKNKFEDKARKLVGKIKFLRDAVELYYCAIDPKTEKWVRVLAFSALAYFIIPIDAIPDFTPFLGYTDDAGIIIAAIKKLSDKVTDEHRAKAKVLMEGE